MKISRKIRANFCLNIQRVWSSTKIIEEWRVMSDELILSKESWISCVTHLENHLAFPGTNDDTKANGR